MLKTPLKFIITIALTLGLSISFQSLLAAWQAPTASPPNNNIDTPINTGSDGQTKNGDLTLNGSTGLTVTTDVLVSGGSIGIGTLSPAEKLDVDGNATVSGSVTANKFNGDGSDLSNIEWVNIINKPDFQEQLTQSCSEGYYIRTINSDGTVECDPDEGVVANYNNCAYDSDSDPMICPEDTIMRGFSASPEQAYCCGATAPTCTPYNWTSWTNIYCTATCSNMCQTDADGMWYQKRTRVLDSCLIEHDYRYNGHCSISCGPLPRDCGDNNDTTPEELQFYKNKVKENKDLIERGKKEKALH